jgi:hypothetical protein
MGRRKDKLLRKTVRREVGDQSRQYLAAMLGSPFLTRLRWAVIIVFRLGLRDLLEEDAEAVRKTG